MVIMGKIHQVEKFFDVLMSFATLVGFASTAYLVWIFLHTTPQIVVSTTNVGAPGIAGYPVTTYVIQGVPFFWIFTSLISLSAGHTYRAAKHLILTMAGKHYFPHAPHLMRAVQPTPTPTAPSIRQTETKP
jgi:hypothetical protein